MIPATFKKRFFFAIAGAVGLMTLFFSPALVAGPAQWMPLVPPSDAEVYVYGFARTGVLVDNGEPTVTDGDSSIGFAAQTKIGDDLGAIVVFENSVWTSNGSIVTPSLWGTKNPTKFAYVGLKGGWGALTLGSQWAPLAGAIGNYVDKSHFFGGHGFVGGQYKISHSTAYQKCWDRLCYKAVFADLQMNDYDSSNIDRATIGGNWRIGDLVLGGAYQDHGDNDYSGFSFQMPFKVFGYGSGISVVSTKVGIARKAMDNYKVVLAGGYSSTEETGDGWDVNLQYGALWMDYSEDATGTPRIVVDVIHALSKKVALIGEVMVQDGTDQRGVALLSMDF